MQTPIPNILIVDDHPENLIALEAVLDGLNASIVKASSGQEALKAVLKYDFAVILLDVQMSGLDGFETAQMIKAREKSRYTPIIFVTAINRSDEHVYHGYDLGAVDYLFKPVVPEILRAKVVAFLDQFRLRMDVQAQAEQINQMNAALEEQLEEVKRLNAETVALNRELESFSYSVSHDLRAPLRSISSFSQALLEDYEGQLDDQGRHYLQRIHAGCRRMSDLIQDLLALSRLSREKLTLSSVDISRMVTELATELHQAEPERQVNFLIEPDIVVDGDARLLHIMFENLMRNAWKFTSHHSQATIRFGRLSPREENGSPVYYLQDDGAGFDMAYADQLFIPFQRLHADQEFEGTGIGLATVQRIVRRHQGTMWAEGKVEEGATFYFTL